MRLAREPLPRRAQGRASDGGAREAPRGRGELVVDRRRGQARRARVASSSPGAAASASNCSCNLLASTAPADATETSSSLSGTKIGDCCDILASRRCAGLLQVGLSGILVARVGLARFRPAALRVVNVL